MQAAISQLREQGHSIGGDDLSIEKHIKTEKVELDYSQGEERFARVVRRF